VSFLRKLFGGSEEGGRSGAPPADQAELDEDERRRELELARGEAERLDDLQQRQLRYADRAWTPPDQGGERRSDDEGDVPEK
jgi:hypothetical protein